MKQTWQICLSLLFCFFLQIVGLNAQPLNWQPRGIGGGGSMFFPTFNPANDNEFYITCDMSQLFHSTDFGNSYTQIPFTKLQSTNHSTYEFTNNSNYAYSLASDGNIAYAVKTTDGGNTWNTMPADPIFADYDDAYVLKADYNNPGRILLGGYGLLFFSSDYGASFHQIWTASNNGAGVLVGGVFFDGDNIYIGTNDGVLYSANGGSSFSKLTTTGIPSTESIISFTGARQNGVTRFYCITGDPNDVYNGMQPSEYWGLIRGVYSMDAGGANAWSSKLTGININTDFMMFASMARNDINTVYLGGSDGNTGGNCVIKTTDGGNTWNKVLLTANNQNIATGWSGSGGDRGWSYGETCFGITVAPNNSQKVLFGDFGFVHKTSDGGNTWEQAYVNKTDEHPAGANTPQKKYYHSIGLENTTSWQVFWADANNMFACYSDIRGIRSKDGGNTWSFDYTGHTANTMYRIAKHAVNNTLFAGTSGVHDMYQSTRLQDAQLDATDNDGKIIYSANVGADWQLLHQFGHPVFWVATDPNNQNRMYASVIDYTHNAGGIWMTNNLNNLGSSAWTQLAAPPRTQGHPASIVVLNDGKMVCTFSGRRTSAGFTASSGVFIYDPVLNSWTDVSDAGMQYWTKDIIIDPSDATQSTWYVCVFSGWGGAPNGLGGLYRTTNRGTSWTKLTGSQFDRVTSITFNPSVTNTAYLTTETQGLWISSNMNAATPTWSLVDAYSFRQPERVFFNPYNLAEIWVSSFGNGMKLGQQSIALPVHFISFSGNRYKGISTLQWSVAEEEPGDVFSVERSNDAIHFSGTANIKGITGNNNYQQNDTIAGNEFYYRIKLTSATGATYYTNVIVLKDENNSINDVRLTGNPVSGNNIQLETALSNAVQMKLLLMNTSGQTVMQKNVQAGAGNKQINVSLPAGLANGTYMLQVNTGQITKTIQVVIAK
ncbi:MAG: T9SS type A sorting domain-containing protein [Chitinophagaceae bacterium]